MRKSKLFLIFTLINFIFCFSSVEAVTDITTFDGVVGTNCTPFSCWPVYNSKVNKSMRGMRVSLMKTDGTSVGQTYNIIADDNHYKLLTDYSNYIVLGSNCNKVQYEMGKCNPFVETVKTWSGSPWQGERLGTASAVSSYFSHLNVSLQNELSNWNIDEIWTWADTEKLPISDDRTIKLLNLLFGLSKEQILNIASDPDLLNDLWIVVEPITMLRYNNKNYLGTNYELTHRFYSEILNNRASVITVIGRMMPCSAMTTGDIAKKYPNAPGVSSGSYFDGVLTYINPETEVASFRGNYTINSLCSSSTVFKNGYPNSGKGVGVGLVYFKDMFKESLDCEQVNNGMSDYNGFMNKIDNAYKKGGLAGIYALPEVANGIKYTYNGEQKIADKTWYINECTCYGAYDTYKTSTGKEIYKLQKGNIMTIFDQKQELFKTFVDNIKNQVKIIEITNPDSVGPVTTWDYGKYESLGCGYIKSSCEEVNFDDMIDISASSELFRCLNDCPNDSYVGGIQGARCERKCYYDYNDRLDESNEILEQCKQLPLYPDDDFTTEFVNSNSDLYNRCFEYYNDNSDRYAPNWNLDSYIDAGCFPSDVEVVREYNCTPRYNVGTCINGENVFYNDSSEELNSDDYWKYCVFSDESASYDINPHKWSDQTKPQTYFDHNISSPYCEVYCIESLTGAFNSETIQVKAGQHFIWNDHSVSGSRTCKTKSIEWDKFTKDLKKQNNDIELAFNEYLSERDQAASYKQTTKRCSEDCGTEEEPETCYFTGYNYSYSSPAYGSKENGTYVEKVKVSKTCQKSGVTFDVAGKLEEYNKIKNDSKKIYDQMKKCYNEDRGSSWISSMNSASGEGSSWDQWLYTVDPSAIINYNYTINGSTGIYSVEKEMDKNITYTEKTNTNDCQIVPGGIEVLTSCNEKKDIDIICDTNENCTFADGTKKSCDLECKDNNCSLNCSSINYDCSKKTSDDTNIIMLTCKTTTGDSCIRQNLSIKKCTEVEMSKGANIEFNIPDGIYEYINKDGHTSFNADQFETLKSQYISEGKSFNYIYLGYSNFPVEYKTPDGLYGKEYGNGELSITYENLGNKLPDKKTDVDTILDAVDAEKYGEWQCQFEVVSELIPDNSDNPDGGENSSNKGDINLIYRPIDLYNPFPDIDANGRETGSNWCASTERFDCSNTNEIVQEYILNNRGVEGHEIYSEEPMYTFILTPSTIKEIRRYNDNNSYADYYGSYSGKTFDFKCNEGTGRNCISDYLTYLIDITNAKNQPGVCVDDKYRTYNDPDNFDACRY